MSKDRQKITDILVELTDALDYKHDYPRHEQAYQKAHKELCKLMDDIDSAERV
jgi:hypothetical protein